jgi:hypothetical protein
LSEDNDNTTEEIESKLNYLQQGTPPAGRYANGIIIIGVEFTMKTLWGVFYIYYHYCSVDTFKKIMDSKVLWLSNLIESNDTQEVTRTFDILWSAVKARLLDSDIDPDIIVQEIDILDRQFELELLVDKPYGVCFCQSPDVLQQWIVYGDNTKGVVLGFDFDWFKGLERQMPHPSSVFHHTIGYDDTLYHTKWLEDNFYEICYDAIKEYGLSAWIMGIRPTFKHYSAFIKNPTFHGELETRIVYYPNEREDFSDNELQISRLKTVPLPHYCLPWTRGGEDNALKTIGFGCNCSLTQDDLHLIMTAAGLSGRFELFHSACSFKFR